MFSKAKISEKRCFTFFLQISAMSGLIEDSLMSAFALSLLQDVVLIEIYEENLTSHKYVMNTSSIFLKSVLIMFTDNCRYSFSMQHQNQTSGNFLKISCNMKYKTVSMNFS